MSAGSTFAVELQMATLYDQLVVVGGGSLTLNSPELIVTMLDGYAPSAGTSFVIVSGFSGALGGDGVFNGKPENSEFWDQGSTTKLRINYQPLGSDTVTLTVVPEPATAGLLALGTLAFAARLRRRR